MKPAIYFIIYTIAATLLIMTAITCPVIAQRPTSRSFDKTAKIPKKQKPLKYIIVVDTKNILYGNKCATRATHKYGFEYLPIPKSQLVTERESSIMFNNLFINLGITLRRGIFWKLALRKRINECQKKSRDMNG